MSRQNGDALGSFIESLLQGISPATCEKNDSVPQKDLGRANNKQRNSRISPRPVVAMDNDHILALVSMIERTTSECDLTKEPTNNNAKVPLAARSCGNIAIATKQENTDSLVTAIEDSYSPVRVRFNYDNSGNEHELSSHSVEDLRHVRKVPAQRRHSSADCSGLLTPNNRPHPDRPQHQVTIQINDIDLDLNDYYENTKNKNTRLHRRVKKKSGQKKINIDGDQQVNLESVVSGGEEQPSVMSVIYENGSKTSEKVGASRAKATDPTPTVPCGPQGQSRATTQHSAGEAVQPRNTKVNFAESDQIRITPSSVSEKLDQQSLVTRPAPPIHCSHSTGDLQRLESDLQRLESDLQAESSPQGVPTRPRRQNFGARFSSFPCRSFPNLVSVQEQDEMVEEPSNTEDIDNAPNGSQGSQTKDPRQERHARDIRPTQPEYKQEGHLHGKSASCVDLLTRDEAGMTFEPTCRQTSSVIDIPSGARQKTEDRRVTTSLSRGKSCTTQQKLGFRERQEVTRSTPTLVRKSRIPRWASQINMPSGKQTRQAHPVGDLLETNHKDQQKNRVGQHLRTTVGLLRNNKLSQDRAPSCRNVSKILPNVDPITRVNRGLGTQGMTDDDTTSLSPARKKTVKRSKINIAENKEVKNMPRSAVSKLAERDNPQRGTYGISCQRSSRYNDSMARHPKDTQVKQALGGSQQRSAQSNTSRRSSSESYIKEQSPGFKMFKKDPSLMKAARDVSKSQDDSRGCVQTSWEHRPRHPHRSTEVLPSQTNQTHPKRTRGTTDTDTLNSNEGFHRKHLQESPENKRCLEESVDKLVSTLKPGEEGTRVQGNEEADCAGSRIPRPSKRSPSGQRKHRRSLSPGQTWKSASRSLARSCSPHQHSKKNRIIQRSGSLENLTSTDLQELKRSQSYESYVFEGCLSPSQPILNHKGQRSNLLSPQAVIDSRIPTLSPAKTQKDENLQKVTPTSTSSPLAGRWDERPFLDRNRSSSGGTHVERMLATREHRASTDLTGKNSPRASVQKVLRYGTMDKPLGLRTGEAHGPERDGTALIARTSSHGVTNTALKSPARKLGPHAYESERFPTPRSTSTRSTRERSATARSPITKSPTVKGPQTRCPTARPLTTRSPIERSVTPRSLITRSPTQRSSTPRSPTTRSSTTRSPTTRSPIERSVTAGSHTPKSSSATSQPTKVPGKYTTERSPSFRRPERYPSSSRPPPRISPPAKPGQSGQLWSHQKELASKKNSQDEHIFYINGQNGENTKSVNQMHRRLAERKTHNHPLSRATVSPRKLDRGSSASVSSLHPLPSTSLSRSASHSSINPPRKKLLRFYNLHVEKELLGEGHSGHELKRSPGSSTQGGSEESLTEFLEIEESYTTDKVIHDGPPVQKPTSVVNGYHNGSIGHSVQTRSSTGSKQQGEGHRQDITEVKDTTDLKHKVKDYVEDIIDEVVDKLAITADDTKGNQYEVVMGTVAKDLVHDVIREAYWKCLEKKASVQVKENYDESSQEQEKYCPVSVQDQDKDFTLPVQGRDKDFTLPVQDKDKDFTLPVQGRDKDFTLPVQGRDKDFTLPVQDRDKDFTLPVQDQDKDFTPPVQDQDKDFTPPVPR